MSFKEEDEDLYSDNNEDRHMLGEKMKNIREADLTSQRALYSAKISAFDPNKHVSGIRFEIVKFLIFEELFRENTG